MSDSQRTSSAPDFQPLGTTASLRMLGSVMGRLQGGSSARGAQPSHHSGSEMTVAGGEHTTGDEKSSASARGSQQPQVMLDAGWSPSLSRTAMQLQEQREASGPLWSTLPKADLKPVVSAVEADLGAYLAAERVLEEASVSVPLEEGRSAFLGQGERSASRAVSLLLARSRAAEALDVVRRARSRTLRMLALSLSGVGASLEAESELRTALLSYWEARAALLEAAGSDWRLARSSLEAERVARLARERELRRSLDDTLSSRVPFGVAVAPLSRVPGELVLAYVSTREGDVGLASLGDRTLAFPRRPLAPGAGPDELAASLLGPARALVAVATRVRIVPGGLGRDVDFASLPFDGRPLVAHAPVVVGLDVPGRARVGEGGAVVVADPLENLPSAREEGRAVTKLLRDAGLAVRHLEGDAATSAGIVEALGHATRLHFAGHGAFAGTEGLDGYLALARGERLSVSDVLAARDAPDVVFLSSCETGRTDASIDVQSLGFAQAFVVAGARAVVAPVRAVDDQASARLAARVYAVLPEPAEGLRRAQLADPGPDASAFRVFVP